MKLRLHANSLRLRLSRSEIARLAETGHVEETIAFAPGKDLSYAIESGPAAAVVAEMEGSRIRVLVPAGVAKSWIESDQTGIKGGNETLSVLVEKDFQCLHGENEEDTNLFANPLA